MVRIFCALGLLASVPGVAGMTHRASLEEPEEPEPASEEEDDGLAKADERCPFFEKCGEDCVGTLFMRKQLSPEARQHLDGLDPSRTVAWSFSLFNDISWDVALACRYNLTMHILDPRPAAPEHMHSVQLLVGSMEAPHPMLMPQHEACDDCTAYWSDAAHSVASRQQLALHHRAVGPHDNSNLTFYGTLDGGWTLYQHKGTPGADNVTIPAMSLSTVMSTLQTPKLDVVRIDADGQESNILSQIAELPEEALPDLVVARLHSYSPWTCQGEVQECKVWKKDLKTIIKRMLARGYQWQLYHHMDFIFLRAT